MNTAREIDPFLKEDPPPLAPLKRHRWSLPRRAPRIPPYDTGARPHMLYGLTRKKERATALRLRTPSFLG
jgi:hypothetical protein